VKRKDWQRKKFTKVANQEECQVLCDEFRGDNDEECNTIFLSYKSGGRNPYYICYLYKACNYLTTTKRKIPGTTFTKQPMGPKRSVANADYFYNNHGIDGACAKPSDDSTEEVYGIFGADTTTPDVEKMEDCQHLCDLSVTCTGYWWREARDSDSEDQCVVYEEPIETTHRDRGKCMIREFHPLTPVQDVSILLKLIPKRLEKLVVKVRRFAKRSAAWCEDAEDGTSGKDSCGAYSSVVDELLKLPLGGRNVMLKKEDKIYDVIYDVGDNLIRDVATQLRALREYRRIFRSSSNVNEDGEENRDVQEILNVAERWKDLCKETFLEPLRRITKTDRGRFSLWHVDSDKKHDTRNVVLLRQVLLSLEDEDDDDFYWMEPLLLAYHTLAEHYNTIIGRPLEDGSWELSKDLKLALSWHYIPGVNV